MEVFCGLKFLDSTLIKSISFGVDLLAFLEIAILPLRKSQMKHIGKAKLLCVLVGIGVLLGQG